MQVALQTNSACSAEPLMAFDQPGAKTVTKICQLIDSPQWSCSNELQGDVHPFHTRPAKKYTSIYPGGDRDPVLQRRGYISLTSEHCANGFNEIVVGDGIVSFDNYFTHTNELWTWAMTPRVSERGPADVAFVKRLNPMGLGLHAR